MVHTVIATVTLSVALVAVPASAQPSLSARPGHGFAAVGVIGAWNDPADGANLISQPVSRGHLLFSGAVFVAPRVGVGIDTFPQHNTTASLMNSYSVAQSKELQENTTLMFTARGRAVATRAVAVDGVFGVGALRQTRTITTEFRARLPPTITTATSDNTSAAFSVGADAPIAVARHVVVIPQMRLYHLRRLANQPFGSASVVLAPLDAPATLLALGVTAGVTW